MKNKPKGTPKAIESRLKELVNSINSLDHSLHHFLMDNDEMHMLNVKSQLRALIASGNERSSMKPLLFELSKIYGIELYIHSLPPVELPAPDNLNFDFVFSPSWSCEAFKIDEIEDSVRYDFRTWLDQPAYYIYSLKEYVDRNTILREFADKMASHYDLDYGPVFELMESDISYGSIISTQGKHINISAVNMFLIDLAMATIYLGSILWYKSTRQYSKIESLRYKIGVNLRSFGRPPQRAAGIITIEETS